jgi:glyoxylase-like metal-dependent hydrolase (beta-lactamase superfamily II)
MTKEAQFNRRHFLKLAGASAVIAGSSSAFQAQAQAMTELPNGAGFYRFKQGGTTFVVLSDGQSNGGNAFPNWGANEGRQDEFSATLARYGAPIEPFINNFNPMLVDTGKNVILIDTGLGGGDTTGKILAHMANAGYTPEDVDTVFITHAHPDHIQGLLLNGAEVFANAQLIMGEAEFNFWTGMSEAPPFIQNVLIPLKDRFSLINDGNEIVPGLSAVLTPGHTPGHLSVLVDTEGQQVMHYGDAGGHHILSLMYPEHFLGFDADKEQVVKTRATLFDRSVSDELLVVGYHFAWPGVGRILRQDNAYMFAPAFFTWS